MDDEPTNAAAELARHSADLMNDEEWARSNGLTLATPDFVRYDRRRLTAQPPADRDGWIAAAISFAEVSGGWPAFSVTSILAVRGKRLAVYRFSTIFGDSSEIEFVMLSRADEAVERMELLIFFDPEDVDLAIAEMDRLHDELTHG